jgi:ribosome maturation protein Sdo1
MKILELRKGKDFGAEELFFAHQLFRLKSKGDQ